MSQRWVVACTVDAATERDILPVRVEGSHLIVVRDRGRFRVFERACPHEQADLAQGRCLDGKLFCPRHLAWFGLHDGHVSPGWGFRALRCYPARAVGGQVLVDAAALERSVHQPARARAIQLCGGAKAMT